MSNDAPHIGIEHIIILIYLNDFPVSVKKLCQRQSAELIHHTWDECGWNRVSVDGNCECVEKFLSVVGMSVSVSS